MSERIFQPDIANTIKPMSVPRWARAATVGMFGVSVALGVAGCGNGGSEAGPVKTVYTSAPQHNRGAGQPAEGDDQSPVITFDVHGSDVARGGANFVELYADPSPDGKGSYDGVRYASGQVVSVDCVTQGRTVHRHPEQGETPGQSSMWVRVSGAEEFATLAYANLNVPIKQVPKC